MVLPEPNALRSTPSKRTLDPVVEATVANKVVGSVAPTIADAVFLQTKLQFDASNPEDAAEENCIVVLLRMILLGMLLLIFPIAINPPDVPPLFRAQFVNVNAWAILLASSKIFGLLAPLPPLNEIPEKYVVPVEPLAKLIAEFPVDVIDAPVVRFAEVGGTAVCVTQ